MTSPSRASGLDTLAESMALCQRRGGVADSGPGDLSPTMRMREACRRDRRFAAVERPLLIDVLGPAPCAPAHRLRWILRVLANWITG